MTFVEKRNRLIYALSQAVGRPVLLDSQTQPEVEPPFIIYSVMSDYETTGGSGNLALVLDENAAGYRVGTRRAADRRVFFHRLQYQPTDRNRRRRYRHGLRRGRGF